MGKSEMWFLLESDHEPALKALHRVVGRVGVRRSSRLTSAGLWTMTNWLTGKRKPGRTARRWLLHLDSLSTDALRRLADESPTSYVNTWKP